MVDFNKLVSSLTSGGLGTGLAGGVAGGALVSALTSKSGRKAVKSVAQIGGLAAVGALAWNAYKNYQQQQSSGPAVSANSWQQLPQSRFDTLAAPAPTSSDGLVVLRTMIAAAMADGHLGPSEQMHIFERLDQLGLSAEERSTLFDELRRPLTGAAIASQIDNPVLAIEVYTAAVVMLSSECAAGRQFLHELSTGLNLPPALCASIEDSAPVPDALSA